MSRNIVIIGSSGTIGSSLVNIYKKNLEDNIFAFSRGYNFMHAANVVQDHINILDEESIENTVAKYFKEKSIESNRKPLDGKEINRFQNELIRF